MTAVAWVGAAETTGASRSAPDLNPAAGLLPKGALRGALFYFPGKLTWIKAGCPRNEHIPCMNRVGTATAVAEMPASRLTWSMVTGLFGRPQPLTISMVSLFAIIPFYLVIGIYVSHSHWTLHSPEVALDRELPLTPAWSVIYGSLFVAAFLPVFVLHQQELIRRTIFAYLTAWLVSYSVFLAYPTVSPHHAEVVGEGFLAWGLRAIYSSDLPFNCFPSLHVAQCFLAALSSYRVHRGVGAAAGVWACLVGLSTLYTKQHYVVDVIAGAILAYAANLVWLRGYPRSAIPELERRLAPLLALGAFGMYGFIVFGLWLAYSFGAF
jgi:membrane-associated phospholipid phosphatase